MNVNTLPGANSICDSHTVRPVKRTGYSLFSRNRPSPRRGPVRAGLSGFPARYLSRSIPVSDNRLATSGVTPLISLATSTYLTQLISRILFFFFCPDFMLCSSTIIFYFDINFKCVVHPKMKIECLHLLSI